MTRTVVKPASTQAFDRVRAVGLGLPRVEAAIRYDGAPMLKVGGCFMAALASHPSAEPDTLVVRASFDDRTCFLEDAPDIYYLTDYYHDHPIVLARLSRIDDDALRDLLWVSWRLTVAKTAKRA